ncbi:hypothetical protein ACS0TY_025774 [Phlomoides rotata]
MSLGSMSNDPFDLEVLSIFRIIGAPGILTGGGVFCDSLSVFKGCFAMTIGRGFAFEAELTTTFHALEIAINKG